VAKGQKRRTFWMAGWAGMGLVLIAAVVVITSSRTPVLSGTTASSECSLVGGGASNMSIELYKSKPIILIQRHDAGIAFFQDGLTMGACTLEVRAGAWIAANTDWSPGVRPTGALTPVFGGAGLPRLDWTFTGGLVPPGAVRMDAVLPNGAIEPVVVHGNAFGAWLMTPPNTTHRRDRYPVLRAYGAGGKLLSAIRTSP